MPNVGENVDQSELTCTACECKLIKPLWKTDNFQQ